MLVLAACSSDNNNPPTAEPTEPPAATLKVQVLHGSPDAPAVNVLVDGNEVLSGVDYKVGSGQLTLDEGTYSVQVDGILPGGNVAVTGPVDLELAGDTIYTIAAVNGVAEIEPVVISQPDTAVSAASAGYLPLPAGDYDVTVTPTGTKTAAIGPATISVSDGGIYTAVARDPLPGAVEFGLIVSDDFVN